AALAAVPVLITLAVVWGSGAGAIVAASVYGASLILMLVSSALYNHVGRETWQGVLRRLDHSAIYFKIAGTYTPFTTLSGHFYLLVGLWGAALAGAALRCFGPVRLKWIAFALYLAMGWAGLFLGGAM